MPTPSPRHAQDPILVALGNAIREIRLEAGMSQEDLAHGSQIDRAYMSSIERGRQNPGIISIARIAGALGLAVSELMRRAQI
ncbi:helix-turn-helix domain-containing protein [Paucibacter sp. B51]|uniref:helix-turn-helix domain-containing protein n=1 Tax=Paucibacter sp. B51 TaxID=2993315 RepID=UPI0022EC0110|nr:helix-turn-helix transcriptional regulator [Paucibacter sp. B51]